MSETTQDLLAKAYEMQRTDAALAMVRERDYWERRALQAEAQLLAATPPTPDLAAAIQEVRQSLETAAQFDDPYASVTTQTLKDLLAAVSRPAEARGEPWGYACRVRYTDNVASDWWIRFRTEELPTSHQAEVIPLYAHPAPSGGGRCTNPHNDTSDPNHHCWHARETCCHCETSRDVPAAPRPESGAADV